MAADDIEKFFQELPHKKPDLKKLEASLQEIISQLMAKKEYLDNLERTLRESGEEDLDESLNEIERIRIRIIFLIDQTKLYLVRLVPTQGTPSRDESDVQNFTALLKELNLWLTKPRNLVRERVDPNDVLEVEVFIKRLEDSLNECRTRLQNLVSISPRVQELGRNPNLAPLGAQSLIPQLETLHRELTLVDRELTDRLQALQEILNSFINRSREPSKPEPELAATKLNRKTKPAPIFVPQPVPAVRKEGALVRPDGSFTNVCSRTEETYSSFPSPRSTIESTFKPIEMSDPRSVHTKSSKHKKPPVITTETYDDSHRSTRDERTPDNEYSAEQVSQKVFDFLEIDEPESLSLGDETIDSRASPIPNEEVIDLDSPRFEYYEEIKFKDPMLYSQSRPVEQHEMYHTSDLPESSRRRQFVTQTIVDETGKPVTSTTTRKYYIRGARDPQQVKEYKYVQLFDPNNLDETNQFEVSTYDEQPTTVQVREGSRTVVRTIRRRIIRKVVIINGKETVTEEVVEEPVEETVSEHDRPEITEIEDDSQQEPGKQYYVVSKGVEKPKSETPDSSRSRIDEYPSSEVRKVKSILRPEAKEFTPSYSLSKSTDISLPQDSSISSDTTKPARFGFMIRDSPLDVSEHSLPEDTKPDDRTSEPTSNVIHISFKEEDMKGVRPQRKKKKKRKGERDTEEPNKTGDDQKDTESLDEDEDESDEDLIEKDGKLIKMTKTKTIVVMKDGKSPSLSDSSKASKPKQGSKDTLEEIEKMIIVTDDKTRKPHERKDDEKKPKEPTETKVFAGKEKTSVTASIEKPVERKPKDGKTPIEPEAPENPIPTNKETDKKTKDKKGKPDDLENREKPITEGMKTKERTPDDIKPKDRKEAKPKPEDNKEEHPDDIRVVLKAEDRKLPEKEKLRPLGITVTETNKFEQEPGKKGKPEVFGKVPEKPRHKFFDISQFIEQEQEPTVDEPSVEEKGDKSKPEKPVKDEEPSKAGRPDEKDKTRGKKEKTPDKDKLFGKEVKSSQLEPRGKDEESFKVGQPKGEKDKSRPVDESKAPEQREQEPFKVSKPKEGKAEKDKPKPGDIGKTPDQEDKEPSQLSKTKEDKPKPIGKDVTEVSKALEKDKLPKKEEPLKVEKPKDEKVKEDKTPEVSFKSIGEIKVEDSKPSEKDKLPLKDEEFKVGKPKDIKDKDKREKTPKKDETEPIDVSKTVEHKTFPTHEHLTHKPGKPDENDDTKPTKKHDKGKKEKTPEDKSKPGEQITETLKFIQFGYRVSPEDERSEVIQPTQDKPKDKPSDKEKPIEVGKKPEQEKPRSEDDKLLRTVKLIGRKEKTPDKDKPVALGKAPEQTTETDKPKDDKDKKGKKPDKDKPEDFGKAPDQPKSQEPSKFVEEPVEEKDKDRKEKSTQKDKPKPSGKDAFDITAFIEHEKPSTKDTQDKTTKLEERKPKTDKEKVEKPEQPKVLSEDNELLRTARQAGRKETTPDKDKPVELDKAPQQPTEIGKPKDDKNKKGKKPDKDKPEELAKTSEESKPADEKRKKPDQDKSEEFAIVSEQPKSQEAVKEDKPSDKKDKDRKGKPTMKDQTKPSDKDTFDIIEFISHEKSPTKDTLDKVEIREPEKPKDDKTKKEKTPDKGKPVEFGKMKEQPKDDKETKEKSIDKKKPVEFKDDKKPEKTKPSTEKDEPQKDDQLPDDKEKGKKDKAPKKDNLQGMDKVTEQPKRHSEEEKLTQFGRPTEKDKTPDKEKPAEIHTAPEPSQRGEKPKDEKELKQKTEDKGERFDVSKKPEEQKVPSDEEDVTKGSKLKGKRKKEKTPEEDKSKLGKEITDTLKFIQYGYRVSPEDERSQVVKPAEDKPSDKDKPIEVGKKPEQRKPCSEDEHLRTVRLTVRKEKTPDKSVDILGKTPEQQTGTDKPKEDQDKKGKKPDKDKPEELIKAPEQPTETEKPKEDKDKKGMKADKDKPDELAKAPEGLKSQEPSKVTEKPVEKDGKDRKGKPTQKDKSKPLDKDTFDITGFIEHEKPSTKDAQDKTTKPEQRKPEDDKEREEKPKQPKILLEEDELSRTAGLTGREEKTPDADKPVDILGKAPGQPTETSKLKEAKNKKGKEPDKDKPEELIKAPEQPKSQEPVKIGKPTDERDKERKEKPTQKDKSKELEKNAFDITEFIAHEKPSTRDTLDKVGKPEEEKPKDQKEREEKPYQLKAYSQDDGMFRDLKLVKRKEKTPDKDKPVELVKATEQPTEFGKAKDDKDKKGKKPDKDKPEELAKTSEESKPADEKPKHDKDKKGKKPDQDKPEELAKAPEETKTQEPSKIADKLSDEKDKDNREKPTKKGKSKPLDKNTFDITEFIAHEKTTTREIRDKVGIQEPEKPKDDKTRKEKTPDKDKPVELGKVPKQLSETGESKDGKDKLEELAKAPEEPKPIDEKLKDDKQRKGKKQDKDKPEEIVKAPEQPKGQEPSKVVEKPVEVHDKDRKGIPTAKDKDTLDITKVSKHEEPLTRDSLEKVSNLEQDNLKDKKPGTDKPDDIEDRGKDKKPSEKDKFKVAKPEVVETITLTGEKLPSRDFIEVTKLIEHEKPPVREQPLFKEDEPADDKKKGKKGKIPDNDKTERREQKEWEVKTLISQEKPEKDEREPSKVGKPADEKVTDKTKKDKYKPIGLEKEVFGTMEFIQREKALPEDGVTFKTEKDTFDIVKTQQPEKPSKVGKDKNEKTLEKPLDVGKTTERMEQEPTKVSKPKDRQIKEKAHEGKPKPEEPKLSETGKLPSKEQEVIQDKPREEKGKEMTFVDKSEQFDKEPDVKRLVLKKQEPTKDKSDKDKAPEELSVGDKRKDGQKKDKGRKEMTPEEEEPKPVGVFKPEEKDKSITKEQERSALGKPKDYKDKPAEMGKAPQQPETPVGKDIGKKEKTPDEDGSKAGKEITETLKFIQFGYRVSPEGERSQVDKTPEDKFKEPPKGKSPDKDTTEHTIVKVTETIESIQKPKDGKHPDKVEKEKTQEGKPKPVGKVTEDIKPKYAEEIRTGEPSKMVKLEPGKVLKGEEPSHVDKPKEEKDKSKKDKSREDKTKPVGTEPLELVKSLDEGRIPEKGKEEKTSEDKFKLFGKGKKEKTPDEDGSKLEEIRKDEEPKLKDDNKGKDKPLVEKEKTPGKPDQPLEKDKPKTAQKGGVDVISFIQHEKSPVSDREPSVGKDVKEKDKGKKDTAKEKSLEKDIFDTTKFIEGEKPVKEGKPLDKKDKEPKEKMHHADKPKAPDTMMEEEPSKPGKPKDFKEKEGSKKEKRPETPKSQEEEEPKDKGRKEKTPDTDKTKDIGKVQEQPKEHVEKVGKPKDDKGTTEKTSTDVETIPAVDKLPSKKQERSKPVKEEDKVQRTVDKDKKLEQPKPSAEKVEPQTAGQLPDDKDKGKKDKASKKEEAIGFGKEPEQPKSGEKHKDDKEPVGVCKKPEQQKLATEEELLKGVKLVGREKEKTLEEEDKSKPGKVVTATLKFIQQETDPSQHNEPSDASKATLDKPNTISKAKSPGRDIKNVIVQITEKIKDEHVPSKDQESSKEDKPEEEKDKERKGKSTTKDKPTPSGKDAFDITAFIEHEKPSTEDTKDKTTKPEQRKPKDDKEKEEKPKQTKVLSEDDELSKTVRPTGRKEKTPEKDKPVELGKAPQQPTETGKHKDDNDKKGKKPDKDKPEELGGALEQPKSQGPSKVADKPTGEKDKDRKGKPTQKDQTKPSDKDTFDITEFIIHEKSPTKDTLDKVGIREPEKPKDDKTKKEKTPDKDEPVKVGEAPDQPTEIGKPKDDKNKKGKKADRDKLELAKAPEEPKQTDEKPKHDRDNKGKKPDKDKSEEFARVPEQPKEVEKVKDDKGRKEKTPDTLTEMGKKPEKPKLVSEDDQLFRTVRLMGRKEKTPDKDKPVELGKAPEQSRETGKDDKDKKGKKPDKDEPQKVDQLPDDKEKDKKGKDKSPEKDKSVESAKMSEEQKLLSEEEQFRGGKPKDKGKKEKASDEGKGKPEKGITETLKFIQQETYLSQPDEPSKESKGLKALDKGLKDVTSKFGVDTLSTTKLIEHEKPESKKPDSLKFKIVTQGYDEKGEPVKEGDEEKPEETPEVYETTRDGRRIVVSFKKGEYPEDDDSQKKGRKKPEQDNSKPSEKGTPETEVDKGKGKIKREEKLPEDFDKTKGKSEEAENKQKEPVSGVAKLEDPTQKVSLIGKEPEESDDKRVREVLIGKDSKPKPEDTQDSFASIARRRERKTPETTKEKPEEPEQRLKSKKKDRKPKSTTKHDEDLPTDEEDEKTPEPETVEKEDQPAGDQTSLTGTIVSMTKKLFGFGGRKEPKPETAKPEEVTKPSSKPQKDDKASDKKGKTKEPEEGSDKPKDREPSKVATAKQKPEPVGKEKTVLFPDKPSDTQPQHGVIPAPVGKKPEADAFGKLVHKPQKPEKSPELDEEEDKPSKPSAPTYADLFTQTSTPETSPRDTDKAHKTSQTKEYQTTEEGIQTEDDRGKVPVREYQVRVRKDEEVDDGKQTTEKYQQTSKPQSPTVTTTTVSSQTSPQIMSPEERDAKKKEKVIRAKFVDKKSGKSKPEDEEDDDEEFESRKPGEEIAETQLTRPGEEKPEKGRDEPFGVYVKAKVSVTPTDVPSKSKKDDKKERKRKWKGEPGHEDDTDNIEVTGVVSVDSPEDLIESETQSWRVVQTPQAEVSVNVKQGDKFVTDFLEGERAALDTTRDDPKDPKGKKDKKSKKPIKDREDEFRLREGGDIPKGLPTRKESSPESDEYGIDVNVRVAGDKSKGTRTPGGKHRPESEVDINAGITFDPSDERRVRREKGTKPEDDDKYKVSVDVKVKSGETPAKTPGKTADMGVNVPSPETPLEPEDLTLYLEKAKTLGQDRSKKMQNMKNNKRGFTWIIPSSRFVQGEPVKTNIKDIDDNVDKLRDAIARRDYILTQRIFVYLIRNIDDWLELVEYRIRLNRGNPNEGPNQDKVNELRYLNDEIDGVGRNVRELLRTIKDVPGSDKSDIINQLRTYVEQLEPQIKEIQETTEMEKDNAVKDLSRWEEFLNGVNNLSVIVTENRNNLERVLDSDGSTSSKLEELEKIELTNREYMERALKLIALAKDLANEFPNQEIPPETYTTLETTKLVQSNLDSERDRLLQLLSLADEYEQTLKEFAQVIEVADNLVESPITITSLQHLQDEMQKHRKFFVNLSHCRAILESLESNLDDETRGLHNSLHTKLHSKASSILDKAASRAQQMAMAASKWTILDKGVRNERQWLQVAHQRLPDLQQVKSTDYDQYISLYQSLASDTAMHHAKILQLMDVANNLQDIITCVGLERFYDDYLNVILKLQEEIRMSLEKLLAFQDMWTLYEIMTKKLDAWMKATEEELKTLKAAPDRAKMRQFWELKAQYEVHNRLKQEMGNNFEKAVQFLPIADEMYQRQILGKLEDRWKKLEKEIKGIQDSAMATLSAPDVPVNEKLKLLEDELNELNDTVNDLHGIIKTDEELNLYIERLQVLNKRLDTIQEELGRLGLLPATESEKVGYLLGLARGLEQQLLEELNQSHCLREKLLALQKGLERTKRNQNSITGMLDQCGAAQSMGSEVVEQAVKTCENVSADLSDQWQDMMDLRKVLHNLPMKLRLSVSPIGVEREFSQLQEIHTVLEERCASLLHLLRHRLSLWKKFEKQLEKVQQNLEDTDYMVELLTLQGSVDFDRLQTATDRLKDLHDSVAEREDLIKELKELASPLVSSCDPEVASQLNAQVDETVTAWNDTKKNLYQIVDKYKDAVKLWKNYREGRDDIRKWIDQQWGALDILQDKPEEALQHIKECKETLANQKARLDELKKLVAQIAADIGLDPGSFLECEVEDLGKRLEDVKDTLTTLTSVAESNSQGKDDCKDELVKAKKFLGSVQKSLNVVGEDGNTLSTLRDHLLALTKTESQVQNVKERSIKMNEKPHEIRNETSVVEILELWQQVFQETFQQYYRLSAKLVKSQDGAAALQLWQEYLRHVQTFLAGSLPEDYDGLRETQRLCEVHQNLLTSQQSVLLSRKGDPGIRDFSQALQEQFNSLANLHNETLARIMDRHNEVNKRLKLWDTYRHDQSKLLSWLRDMTRDQSRLQLRYIHLRRLPKLLEQIDMLLSRIPQGKAQIQEQKKQQEDIVKFCDEALATSIKMESVATAERINNIEASLMSWKDFLNRVQDLQKNYESDLEKVEKVCDEITNELSSPAPVSFSAIQSRLDLCRDLKRRISELSKNIEEANVTYDQLKECLSPYDMKMLSQRLWLIGQRQGDLEHHLLLQILWLEDRLETQQAFNRRHGRFVNWAEDLIKRFDKNSTADPTNKFLDLETRAKRLETEVEIELSLKNREYNALHAMANNIIDLSKEDAAQEKGKIMPKGQNRIDYEIMKSDVEKKIKEVDELWDQLKNLKCARLERKSKLTTTMNDLWNRMEDIKIWLMSVEKKLEAPNVIEKSNKKCIDKLLKDHEDIQENIKKQSGNVGEVLNLCELFLGDPAVDVSGIDTNEFESAQQALEKRWKAVCLSSTERKNRILLAWELLLELSKICKEQEKWLNDREKALQSLSNQADNLKLSDVQKMLDLMEKEKQELESRSPALKILDASYSKLAQESRLPADNIKQLAGPAKAMISKWHNLNGKWKNVWDKISKINKLRDDFIKSHNGSIVMLTNISAKLMQAELIPNLKKRLKKVSELEKELERESGVLRKADETGLELMRTCPEEQNVSATQKMVDEYQIMWKELRDRFADVKNKSLENVESKEIQVSTLTFETDSEVQVDTLPHMDRLTSRDAYGFELDVALRECDQNLTGLEKILRSSEEEMGANVPTHKALAKIIATCTSSVELVQHLNKTLLEDCGMNDRDARTVQVNEISVRFQDLVARAREREKQLREASERGRLTCPICSGRNWQQLENDLWRLEQWVQYAEAIQRNRPGMPESIEALEDVIQAHRELLIDLDSHRSIIVSLNIVGDHLADHAEDEEKARSLRERLKGLNLRWDNVCTQAAQWQGKLQKALIENPEFHDTIDDLFKWLEHTETVIRNSEPVDLGQDRVIIEAQYKKFKILSKELEKFEPRVQSLQEAAVQLLDKGGSARERLNALRLRLLGMRRLIKVYLIRLGAVLGNESIQALDQTLMSLSQEMLDGADTMSQVPSSSTARTDGDGDIDNSSLRRGFRFLGRVFRASLPIQALMLLVLGAATLVPDEYYSCAFSNNARFQSYYPNGPPPI